jgi:hypothetical protein
MHRWALIATLGLAGCCGPTAKNEQREREAAWAENARATAAATAAAEAERRATERAAGSAEASVRGIWHDYDRMPKTKRTTGAWGEALRAGQATTDGMAPAIVARVEAYNYQEARRRGAVLINAEATADGERREILVPSDDRAKCLVWGSMWSKDPAPLRSMGFERIRCKGKTPDDPERIWRLGGE